MPEPESSNPVPDALSSTLLVPDGLRWREIANKCRAISFPPLRLVPEKSENSHRFGRVTRKEVSAGRDGGEGEGRRSGGADGVLQVRETWTLVPRLPFLGKS